MKLLITYDVETMTSTGRKRLRNVAKACQDYGQRVQNSVFECTLTNVQYLQLKNTLETIIDREKDSIRIYHLPSKNEKAIDQLGRNTSYDPDGVLLI